MKNLFLILFFVFSALLLSIGLQAKTKQEIKEKPKIDVPTVAQKYFKVARNVRVKFLIINSKVRQTNQGIYNSKLNQIASEVKNKGTNRQPAMLAISFFGNFIYR
jgi:hypothetical protein